MNCCICGPVKNCGPYLSKVLENMAKIGSFFDEYQIIIYYDKSSDNSLQKLKEYQTKNSKMSFYVCNQKKSPFRTHNIATARNFCLNYIRENREKYPYFIMMDMDDVNSKEVNTDILKKHLYRNDWDGLSFNTSPHYYDIWALSIKPYYISFFAFEKTNEMYKHMLKYITDLLNNLQPDQLLQCASAFNGFAIYKTEKFIECNYDGKLRYDLCPMKRIYKNNNILNSKFLFKNDDCEHRAFHFEAINKNNARIMISPEFLFK